MKDGACVDMDPEVFHDSLYEVAARRICIGCEVREVCLNYALRRGEKMGVWGAKNPQQRAEILARKYKRGRGRREA